MPAASSQRIERMFAGKAEVDVLRALGYFDHPAELNALKLLLPAFEEQRYRIALKRLYDARLITTKDPKQPLDCHPLVRGYRVYKRLATSTCSNTTLRRHL